MTWAVSGILCSFRYGVVRVAGLPYYTSELLYSVDPFAYGDVATKLKSGIDPGDGSETE